VRHATQKRKRPTDKATPQPTTAQHTKTSADSAACRALGDAHRAVENPSRSSATHTHMPPTDECDTRKSRPHATAQPCTSARARGGAARVPLPCIGSNSHGIQSAVLQPLVADAAVAEANTAAPRAISARGRPRVRHLRAGGCASAPAPHAPAHAAAAVKKEAVTAVEETGQHDTDKDTDGGRSALVSSCHEAEKVGGQSGHSEIDTWALMRPKKAPRKVCLKLDPSPPPSPLHSDSMPPLERYVGGAVVIVID